MDTKDFSSKRHLAEITESVGLLSQPPTSHLPLPKKWLPRSLSFGLRVFLLPFVLLDQGAKKIARVFIRPPFKKTGECKKRGNCCYYITMRKRRGIADKLQRFWMMQVHSFFLREKETFSEGGNEYYLLGCSNLQKDGKCSQYKLRPSICREWPIIEIFGYPKLLKGCGYWFVAKRKEHQHIVQEYSDSFGKGNGQGKSSGLPILNDPVFYVNDPVPKREDS